MVKHLSKHLPLYVFAACMAVALFCTRKWNNPLDPGYGGSYSQMVSWPSRGATLEVFRQYPITYTSGADRFVKFETDSPNVIDMALFDTSYARDNDTLLLYFVRPFGGQLQLACIRPNLRRVDANPCTLTVVNPFVILARDTVAVDDTVRAEVGRRDGTPVVLPESLWVDWRVGGGQPTRKRMDSSFTVQPSKAGDLQITATVIDTRGNPLDLQPLVLHVPGRKPSIARLVLPDSLSLGDLPVLTIAVTDSSSDSVAVSVSSLKSSLLSGMKCKTNLGINIRATSAIRDTGATNFHLWAVDTNGLRADTIVSAYVHYVLPAPRFSPRPDTVPVGDTTVFYAYDATGKTHQYTWRHTAGGNTPVVTASDALRLYFGVSRQDTLTVFGTDSFGYTGPSDTLRVTARAFTYNTKLIAPATVFARRWATWTAQVRRDSTLINPDSVQFHWTYPVSLSHYEHRDTVELMAANDTSFTLSVSGVVGTAQSSLKTVLVDVLPHRPVLSFSAASYTYPIETLARCTVSVNDLAGKQSVTHVFWKLNQSSFVQAKATDTVWSGVFTAPGTDTLRAWAVDTEGFVSDTNSTVIIVTSDKPQITGLQYQSPIYTHLRTTLTATVNILNTGAPVDSVYWDFDGDTTSRWDSVRTDNSVRPIFDSAGVKKVLVKCLDRFGKWSDPSSFNITVDPGAPTLSAIAVDTTLNNIFVNDIRSYRVTARDTNGTIQHLYFEVDNAPTATKGENGSVVTDSFSYAFAISTAGSHTVRIIAQDNDGLRDTTPDLSVNVRLGAPALWGDSGDTLWVVVNNGVGFYKIHANAFDTNGVIQKYLWNDLQGWQDSTAIDSVSYQFRQSDINHGASFSIGARDDDGLLTQNTFVVYADSAPPAPTATSTQPGSPNIQIQWQGLDATDDSLTQFAIILGLSSSTLNDTLVPFRQAKDATFGKSGGWLTYLFNPGDASRTPHYTGNFYFRVLARDARGSTSVQGNGYTLVAYPY